MLILVGHVNFILGAIVHGNVLRHISKPKHDITTRYTVGNIISVTSALLSIVSGIVAILVSRNLRVWKLHIGLLVTSMLNALLSAACCLGLLLAISVVVAGDGEALMKGCNSTSDMPIIARGHIVADCPFDTTRIYDTTLALWFPSVFLAALESGLSIWCFVVGMTLRGLGPCGRSYKLQHEEEAEALAGRRKSEGASAHV